MKIYKIPFGKEILISHLLFFKQRIEKLGLQDVVMDFLSKYAKDNTKYLPDPKCLEESRHRYLDMNGAQIVKIANSFFIDLTEDMWRV